MAMTECKQCGTEIESTGNRERLFCSDACRMKSKRTEQTSKANIVAECVLRALSKKSWRQGDPVWPYTRHMTPAVFVAWCKEHKPSWLALAKPGDDDYNWDESAVPNGALPPAMTAL